MARRTISQRIALAGSEEIREELKRMGEGGERAFRDIQKAAEKLKGPGAEFARSMDRVKQRIKEVGAQIDKVGRKMRGWGTTMSVGITAPLALAARTATDAWQTQEAAVKAMEQALKSTGGVVGRTSGDLQKLATSLQGVTTYGDEATMEMQALLLTFTNVRGDVFDQANEAVLNVATAMGTDLKSAALQVGKALNDPVLGMTALARSGIQFTAQQKAQVKQMVEAGDVASAQALILKELETQFGGMARAMAETDAGKWTQAMNVLGDAFEEVGKAIAPAIGMIASAIKTAAEWFIALPDSVKNTIVILAALAAAIGPVLLVVGQMVVGFGFLTTGLSSFMGAGAALTPILLAMKSGFGGVMVAMRGVMALVAPMLGWPVLLAAAVGAMAVVIYRNWDEIVAWTAAALARVRSAVEGAAAWMERAWSALWAGAADRFGAFTDIVSGAFDGLVDGIASRIDWIRTRIGKMVDWARDKLASVGSAVSGALGFSGGGEVPAFAGGGRVRGPGTPTSDSILARLSSGEFVVRSRAVQHYGPQMLEMLNRMALPRGLVPGYAAGGLAGPITVPAGGPAGAEPHATLNLTIGGELFAGLTAPRETAERLIRFATAEEVKSAGRRPAWYGGS